MSSVDKALNDSWNHFILGKWVECKRANAKGTVVLKHKRSQKLKKTTLSRTESEGTDTNDCSDKDNNESKLSEGISCQEYPKEKIYPNENNSYNIYNTIPFTSKTNPIDNLSKLNNKYLLSEEDNYIQVLQMKLYYEFKFCRSNGEKIYSFLS